MKQKGIFLLDNFSLREKLSKKKGPASWTRKGRFGGLI